MHKLVNMFVAVVLLPGFAASAQKERPNIVVVLADDMGWGDSGTYGHKVTQTPSMDKLASQGMKFTQGYSACGVCSPSRSAILTGRTPYRNGVWRHLSGNHAAHLRASEITYPELLKGIGYHTCHVGKWHLLSKPQFDNPKFPQPGEQGGYDYWMATRNNAEPSHKNPKNFIRNGEPVGEMIGYSAPLVADEAIHWLKEVRDPGPSRLSSPSGSMSRTSRLRRISSFPASTRIRKSGTAHISGTLPRWTMPSEK